jgi:hypothetical protein
MGTGLRRCDKFSDVGIGRGGSKYGIEESSKSNTYARAVSTGNSGVVSRTRATSRRSPVRLQTLWIGTRIREKPYFLPIAAVSRLCNGLCPPQLAFALDRSVPGQCREE